ncbi:hypothetical protein HPP92_003283 [Vanilla planifolia]|uniref:Uncharacterized protein n=1 Tax=Vanilla planifolia TaxID=51239 RepID=A0A835S3B6_VANPL|nr:hypothetical protein HPP92_003674 [Vanilla planifolia]KAG0503211.1 hypothetical protein HPP92_003283 [Vanilla planifolia]
MATVECITDSHLLRSWLDAIKVKVKQGRGGISNNVGAAMAAWECQVSTSGRQIVLRPAVRGGEPQALCGCHALALRLAESSATAA